MTEVLNNQSLDEAKLAFLGHENSLSLQPEASPMPLEREAALRRLLDPPVMDAHGRVHTFGNFEYARDSGLIDMFAYDPDKNIDGLMHILVGDVVQEPSGRVRVEGFHINHDADYVRQKYSSGENTEHLLGASSKHRRRYVERPFEPRKAQVTIGGHSKFEINTNEHGKPVATAVDNAMFPHEYDALAAMQAIRIARDGRDRSRDKHIDGVIVNESSAPMIDGVTQMPMVVVMAEDEKVITAYPRAKESGYMKLTDTAIDYALGLRDNPKDGEI